MAISRREFLAGTAGLAAASVVGVAGPAFGAAAVDPRVASRNRLVVIFLVGGNDGLNSVVPRGDVSGANRLSVYRKVRPTIAYKPAEVLALDRGGDAEHMLGLNPRLTHLHQWYRDGRVAIVQGVDYPNHNYSHFASADIWHTGDPLKNGTAGWLGRHLDRVGVGEGELRAIAIDSSLPLMLQGRLPAAALRSIDAMRFRDGTGKGAAARHAALAALATGRADDPLRRQIGARLRQAVDVVTDLGKVEQPVATASELTTSLLTARSLLEQNLGVECVYVGHHGYDTHTTQVSAHERLLTDLDASLDTFLSGMQPDVAARTLVMIVSEFGRRIGEANGGIGIAGTDHGAAAPVVLVGPPPAARPAGAAMLTGGLHGDHPAMGTTVAPADNLVMTTDLRHLYQAVLQSWLGDPDPIYGDAPASALKTLFSAGASAESGAKAGRRGTFIGDAAVLDADTTTTSRARRGRTHVAGKSADRESDVDGRAVHPVSVAAALAFNAFVAAIVVRSGRFRVALADWRSTDTLS